MSDCRTRAFNLAREIVSYAESRGYAEEELHMAVDVIHEAMTLLWKMKEIAAIILDEQDGGDIEEEIEKMMMEAEEAINDVD